MIFKLIVYMACGTSEISLRFLRGLGLATVNYEQYSYPPEARQSPVRRAAKYIIHSRLRLNVHDGYMANSDHMRRFLLSYAGLPADRVHTVINGIDTELYCPGPAPAPGQYGLPNTEYYALSVCQARPEKRVDFLLEVAHRVYELRPNISLTFVHAGGGTCLQAWLAKAQSMGLAGKFCFVGPTNDVATIHRLASVLVHAADRESFGLALAEAQATGKPVIASEALGPREVISDGETGYLIEKDDVEMFARAVLRLLDDPDLR